MTSPTTSIPLAISGATSLKPGVLSTVSQCLPPVPKPLRFSYDYVLPILLRLVIPRLDIPSEEEMEADLLEMADRILSRQTPVLRTGRTPRCPGCKKFTSRFDRCDHCGYDNNRGWT